MIIEVEIDNFLGVTHKQYTFKGNTLITGSNELGKSTIIYAICWCLSGDMMGDYEEKNKQGIIKNGQLEAKVKVSFISDLTDTFERRLKLDTNGMAMQTTYVNGVKAGITEFTTKFKNYMGIDFAFPKGVNEIRSLIDASYIPSLDVKLMRELIEGIVGKVDEQVVLDTFKDKDYSSISKLVVNRGIDTALSEIRAEENSYTPLIATKEALLNECKVTTMPNDVEMLEAKKQLAEIDKSIFNRKINTDVEEASNELLQAKIKLNNSIALDSQRDRVNPVYTEISKELDLQEQTNNKFLLQLQAHKVEQKEIIANIEKNLSDIDLKETQIKNNEQKIAILYQSKTEAIICPHCNKQVNSQATDEKNAIIDYQILQLKEEVESIKQQQTQLVNDNKELIIKRDDIQSIVDKEMKEFGELRIKFAHILEQKRQTKQWLSDETSQETLVCRKLVDDLTEKMKGLQEQEEESQIIFMQNVAKLKQQHQDVINVYNEMKGQYATYQNILSELEELRAKKLKANETKRILIAFNQDKINLLNQKIKQVFGDLEIVLLEDRVSTEGCKEVCYIKYEDVKFSGQSTSRKLLLGAKFLKNFREFLNLNHIMPTLVDQIEGFDNEHRQMLVNECDMLIATDVIKNQNYINIENL